MNARQRRKKWRSMVRDSGYWTLRVYDNFFWARTLVGSTPYDWGSPTPPKLDLMKWIINIDDVLADLRPAEEARRIAAARDRVERFKNIF